MLIQVVVLITVILIGSNASHSQELLSNPAPRKLSQVKPATKRPDTKKFLLLSGGVYTAAILDMHRTLALRDRFGNKGWSETDPFAKPIIRLPKPAYYVTGLALATGINYLSWRMTKSPRLHKVWFLPQVLTIAGNSYGYATTWH
jgi:hypothetical protein